MSENLTGESMEKKAQRPVFLNLLLIRLPVGGVVSILHRVTGVLLTLFLPVSIYLLQLSLTSLAEFERLSGLTTLPVVRLGMLALLWVFSHHFFAGIRHLLMDVDVGISRFAGRFSAWIVFIASIVLVICTGIFFL